MYFRMLALNLIALLGIVTALAQEQQPVDWRTYFPPQSDPLTGDYVGRWLSGETVDPDLCAQVIALGDNKYRVVLTAKLDMRSPPKGVFEVEAAGGALTFQGAGLRGEVRGDVIKGGRGETARFELKKEFRPSPTLGLEPPKGATMLFNGSGLDAWETSKGWEVLDGAMMVTPKGDYIQSKQTFGDLGMHIEFRNSFMPKARGQQRSNSGVFLQDLYEVQVLDSYGLEGYYDECGALYKVAAPMVNACAPPLQWQTYDIEYRAPRYDSAGNLKANARITVQHNGKLIHNDQELWWITAWTEEERLGPPPVKPGHIRIQSHGNYVQFRNIWVVDKSKS